MKKVAIVGAGFAGLVCALSLSKKRHALEVILIDQREDLHFLPLLPDLIGRGLVAESLQFNLPKCCEKNKISFISGQVKEISFHKKQVSLTNNIVEYDFLVLASGSQTNFYGQQDLSEFAYTLDSVDDLLRLKNALNKESFDQVVIAGGGYTGIEVATNLRKYFSKRGEDKKIVIVEMAQELLGPLPQWMKEYVKTNLSSLGIDVYLGNKIAAVETGKIVLTNGVELLNSALVWAAGVKTANFIEALNLEKSPRGRIKVDQYLRVNDHCFAIGDVAQFIHKDAPLRMAIQFSIAEGQAVAKNLIRIVRGRALKRYVPRDLGYVVPMANNKSCGLILGVSMKGILPTFLHYMMCAYRSFSFKNKIGVAKAVFKDITKGG